MALDKFLIRSAGRTKRQPALVTSTGASDAGRVLATNSAGKLDLTVLPEGVGADTNLATASEALSAGDFVNLYSNASVFSARRADNSNGRPAHGFVLAAVANAGQATVYQLGEVNSGHSGLTVGADYWLGTVGGVIDTPLDETDDDNDGCLSQYLGRAKSATEIITVHEEAVTL
jgi:hypothetical protein